MSAMPAAVKTFFTGALFYWVPASVVAGVWIFLAGTVSDALSPWNLLVFAPGILVVIPAFFMPIFRGVAVVLLSGLLFDASLPIPFEKMESARGGVPAEIFLFGEMSVNVPSMLGFGATWMVIFFFVLRLIRAHVDLVSPRQWLVCALAANALIFLLWAIALGWGNLARLSYWGEFLLNLAMSSAFVVALGWWFFDATLSAYRLCGADLVGERETEES